MASARPARRFAFAWALLVGSLLAATGCFEPGPCKETYGPWIKLLAGTPMPVLFTLFWGFGVIYRLDDAVARRHRARLDALAALALTCVLPSLAWLLVPSGWARGVVLGPWLLALFVTVVLAVRIREPEPSLEAWGEGLSRMVTPESVGRRVGRMGLVALLVFVALIGTCTTTCSVDRAGLDCSYDYVEHRRPGKTHVQPARARELLHPSCFPP